MAIFKCKMCGGTLEINNETVVTCEYCGTQQTLPKLNDDKRANMYDRANHFRRNNEFDKAMGIYEQILNEDNTDAESYWSLVLCRYGIEYVEDPTSHKRIPTVNRAQFTSIFDDDNYKSALEYADSYQKAIYEEEAKAINEIQKGILAISSQEEPFDVFICYKETDNNGRRTPDSVLANDLYHQLTQEGFKVFFARITLEDKLGSAYEPYIFAALNSAKVMVVLGTKPEYFNAVWVRNEWSRYLALIKQGQKKMLIPAYKDMDPYDLPDEFSHLQAQDMSKLGFMQDLIRGIKKIAMADEPKVTVIKEAVVTGNTAASTAPLLKRAFMFLEDGEWEKADDFCEQVLNQDPECAEAYLGKLMAELCVRNRESLKDCDEPFDEFNNYQKAMRFGDEKLKTEVQGYIDFITNRNLTNAYYVAIQSMNSAKNETDYKNAARQFKELHNFKDSAVLAKECLEEAENTRCTIIYDKAVNIMKSAEYEQEYKYAAEQFTSIRSFRDSEVLASECINQAEDARKDAILTEGKSKMTCNLISEYESAIKIFKSISGWKDADDEILVCKEKIEAIVAKEEEAERLENERKAEIARKEAKKRAKRKKIAIITTPIVCATIAFTIILNTVIIPNAKYNKAIALMEDEKYEQAISIFAELGDYKSATKIDACNTSILDSKYTNAISLMNAGKYTEAISAFETLDGYKDSINKIEECNTAILDCKYANAISSMNAGNLDDAYNIFKELGDYKEATNKANQISLTKTKELLKKAKVGDYIEFGTYEQDTNPSNGKENLEWRVLEVKEDKVLVISKHVIDCKQYNTSYTDVTWETCSLRKWLNNDFINTAFSTYEKTIIPTTTVSADKNPTYSTNPGNATQDQVFLLSITEINKYFSYNSAKQCKPTYYAIANGTHSISPQHNCSWWLRSPGETQVAAAYVEDTGEVINSGYAITNLVRGIRPALWIDLS